MSNNYKECPTCHGRRFTVLYGKKMPCVRCEGIGKIPISRICPVCEGKGYIVWLGDTFPCESCHGTGLIK